MSRREDKNALESLRPAVSHQSLLKLLQKLELVSESQVQTGALFNDKLPIAYFSGCGMFNEWKAVEIVAKELRLPCQRLTEDDWQRTQQLLRQPPCSAVPEGYWHKMRALPVAASDDYVKVVLANPLDIEGIKALEFELQVPVRTAVGMESEIVNGLRNCESTAISLDTSSVLPEPEGLELRTPAGANAGLSFKIVGEATLPGAKPSSSIGKRRVLLVDDDADIRAVMCALLEDSMYEVIQAADGREALQAVYDRSPEIIVCDLMMPKMSGREFIQALRNDNRTKNIPVIMLTAASTADNEIDLIRSGADDFVSKTAKSEILLARVGRLLGRTAH